MKVYTKRILELVLSIQIILIPLGIFCGTIFIFLDVFLSAYYILFIILDKRPLIMYLITKGSQTAFHIKKYKCIQEGYHKIYESDELEQLWNILLDSLYCEPLPKNEFYQKHKWLIKHYQKNIVVNEYDVKRIVEIICKYLKLDGNIKVNAVVESSMHSSIAGWFEPIGTRGGNINIVIYDGIFIEQLITVCFHECLHYFNFVNGIEYGEYDELATDAELIYFGVDDIAITGYKQNDIISSKYINNHRALTCGYLNPAELEFIERLKK